LGAHEVERRLSAQGFEHVLLGRGRVVAVGRARVEVDDQGGHAAAEERCAEDQAAPKPPPVVRLDRGRLRRLLRLRGLRQLLVSVVWQRQRLQKWQRLLWWRWSTREQTDVLLSSVKVERERQRMAGMHLRDRAHRPPPT
jgi:hypothetical protein